MAIHVAPIVLHVRGYPDHIDVSRHLKDMTEHYDWHMIVVINDIGAARLEGLDSAITHRDRRALAIKLKEFGAVRVEWRHKGIEKHLDLISQPPAG